MLEKNWVIRKNGDEESVASLANSLGIDTILANLLVQRNIKSFDDARAFFRPQLSSLHDPFLMKDMDRAVARLEKAINSNEKILVYGDYDVDGTTAVSMMYSFLLKRYKNMGYYIPDRYAEGYGVSFKGIDYAAENGFSLIIALDCGIKANLKIEYANKKNIDFIVCDHHLPGSEIPSAAAILDPKQPGCNYPYKELSGCGVGFKLIQAFSQKNNISLEQISPYLDLVAVSIASDIVPIVDENRVMTHYGLKLINESPRIGLKAIIKIAGVDNKEIEINDIVFRIGPRINAAGRIETGLNAVELLISDNEPEADLIAKRINSMNNTRKDLDTSITNQALAIIEEDDELINRKSTVLYNPEWHKGVIGIVASRLTEVYYRPTILLTEANGFATGSARSVEDFDLYKAIEACSDLLESYGGHKYAAGLTMKIENVKPFQKKFEEVVAATITPEQLIPKIEADAKIQLKDITPKFFRILKQFQPFGPENMKPVFISGNVMDNGNGRVVGSANEHLKCDLIEDGSKFSYPAIAFKQAHNYAQVSKRKPFDVCYSVEENEFNGRTILQIKIRDMRIR